METGQESLPVGSVSELYQDEVTPIKVPVRVDDPVRVTELPARSAGMRNWTGIDVQAARVGNNDPRRKRAVLLGYSTTATDFVIVAASQNEAQSGYGFRLPVGAQLVITHQEEIYVKANAPGVILSILNEQWAD